MLTFSLGLLGGSSAYAATWSGTTSTDWETSTNWTSSTKPTTATIASIPGAPANQPKIIANTAVASDVRLGSTATTASLLICGGATTLCSAGNTGVLTDSNAYLGYLAGSTGNATVDGSNAQWISTNANGGTGLLYVGNSGNANLTIQNGGYASALTARIGSAAASTSTLTVKGSGSQLVTTSTYLQVGTAGTGTLNVENGGHVSLAGDLSVGNNAGSTGVVNLSDASNLGSQIAAPNGVIYIGNAGTGTLNMTGGILSGSSFIVGNSAGSVGTATIDKTGTAASTVTSTGNFFVGHGGHGTLLIEDGATASGAALRVGSTLTTGVGTMTVDGVGSQFTSSSLGYVGYAGTGTLNIQNSGKVSIGSNLSLANSAGGSGTILITGGSGTSAAPIVSQLLVNGTLTVANNGDSTINILNGGLLSNSGTGVLGAVAGITGTVLVDGINTTNGAHSTWNVTNGAGITAGGLGGSNLTIRNGGIVNNTGTTVAANLGSSGTILLQTDGQWNSANTFKLGSLGSGSMTLQTGGKLVVGTTGSSVDTFIGNGSTTNATASGTVIVDGTDTNGVASSLSTTGRLYVGNFGQGALTISNGGNVLAGDVITIGQATPTATGTVTVQDNHSSLTAGTALYVGSHGTAHLNILNGAQVSNGFRVNTGFAGADYISGTIGNIEDSHGYVVVDGAGSRWDMIGGSFLVGGGNDNNVGHGSLSIANHGVVSTVSSYIGHSTGSTGDATVTGAGSSLLNSGDLYVGNNGGVGVLTIANQGLVTTGSGAFYNNNATYTTSTNTTYLADIAGSTGTLNIGAASGVAAAAPGTLSTSALVFGAGTGVINFNHTDTAYHFAPSISGAGTINLLSGTTIFDGLLNNFTGTITGNANNVISGSGLSYTDSNGSAYTGTTTVADDAILSVNGTLGGTTSVSDGGTLKGHGTIADVVLANGGMIAPGNSIGTLTVGTLTTAPSSVYQAEINAVGGHDLIHVTGAATLNGGRVEVSYAPGTYLPGMNYTLLSADGGYTGAFDSETDTLGTLFMDARLAYTAHDITLQLVQFRDFTDIASTGNQISAARAAQALGSGNNVYNHIVVMQDAGAARQAFDQLSGDSVASTTSALVADAGTLRSMLLTHARQMQAPGRSYGALADNGERIILAAAAPDAPPIAPLGRRPWESWVQPFGGWGHNNGVDDAASITHEQRGVLLGGDHALDGGWSLGIAGGYSSSDVRGPTRAASNDVAAYHGAVYAHHRQGTQHLLLGAASSMQNVNTRRGVQYNGLNEQLEGGYNALGSQLFAEFGQDYHRHTTTLTPYIAADYARIDSQAFSEAGGSAALHYGSDLYQRFSTTLGLRASQPVTLPNAPPATLAGGIGWRHGYGEDNPTREASFVAGTTPFTSQGVATNSDSAILETSLRFAPDANHTLELTYQGDTGTQSTTHQALAQWGWKF